MVTAALLKYFQMLAKRFVFLVNSTCTTLRERLQCYPFCRGKTED